MDGIEHKVIFFFKIQCINYARRVIELLFAIVFYKSDNLENSIGRERKSSFKKIIKKHKEPDEKDESTLKKKRQIVRNIVVMLRKSPRLNPHLPMDNANERGKPKLSSTRK